MLNKIVNGLISYFNSKQLSPNLDEVSEQRVSEQRVSEPGNEMIEAVKTGVVEYTGLLITTSYHVACLGFEYLSSIEYQSYFNETKRLIQETSLKIGNLVTSGKESRLYDDFPLPLRSKTRIDDTGTLKSCVESTGVTTPLCIENVDFEEIKIICAICLDRIPDRVLIPCGHTFCAPCLADVGNCPTCRGTVNGVMRIYLL